MSNLTVVCDTHHSKIPTMPANNTSAEIEAVTGGPKIIVEVFFLCLLALVILGGNTLVCMAFYRERKLRTTTNTFLISLAAADVMVGVFSVPYWVYFRLGK